jgi:hypothetical protein
MFTDIRNRSKTGLEFNTSPNGKGITLYNASGAAITKGDVFLIAYSSTSGQEHQTQAQATSSVVGGQRFAVALEDIAAAKIGYFAVGGYVAVCNVLGHASLVIGSRLKGVNAQEYLTFDHATVGTAKACAIALEAHTTVAAGLKKVLMLDNRAATL